MKQQERKDKGILFTPDMAEAANKGLKTQTRRLVNPQPPSDKYQYTGPMPNSEYHEWLSDPRPGHGLRHCVKAPYTIGQRLYHKEAHYRYGKWAKTGDLTKTGKDEWIFIPTKESFGIYFDAESVPGPIESARNKREGWYLRSPLFMPKAFARSWWRVTDVGCQRVASISVEDIQKEGLQLLHASRMRRRGTCVKLLRDNWIDLWNSIHGDGAWAKNEWVFYPTFTKIERPKGGI